MTLHLADPSTATEHPTGGIPRTTHAVSLLQGWLIACVIALGAFYLVASAHLFPVMEGDSSPHLVPILNLKSGHGFGSVVWPLTRDYDSTGQHRFLQYPPLFHLIVACVIPRADIASIFWCLGCFATAALGLYAVLILRKTGALTRAANPWWLVVASASLFAVSTLLYMLPSFGRPEAVAQPLLLLATLCVTAVRPAWRPVCAGVFIGLLGATQIAVASLAGILFSVYVSLFPRWTDRPARAWFIEVAAVGVLAMGVFAGAVLLSPLPFMDTMRGIAVHLGQLPTGNFSVAAYYLLPATSSTFYGLFLLVVLTHFLWWKRAQLNALTLVNVALFVGAAWYLAVRNPNRFYNLVVFCPVLAVVALRLLAEADWRESTAGRRRWRTGLYLGYLGLFGLMSFGFWRQVALYGIFLQQGVSYEAARTQLHQHWADDSADPVLYDNGIWALLDHFDHAQLRVSDDINALDAVPGERKPMLLYHQWYNRAITPPAVPGYELVWNDFVEKPSPRVLGIRLTTAVPGYSFALYKPVTAAPTGTPP